MGLYEAQIKRRRAKDQEKFTDALDEIGSIFNRKPASSFEKGSETARHRMAQAALRAILEHYHLKARELPDDLHDLNEQMEHMCRPHGIMRRRVALQKGWYRDAVGAMIGFEKDGTPVALLPDRVYGYSRLDAQTGKRIRITKKTASDLKTEGICFYKPFPQRPMSVMDLWHYAFSVRPSGSAFLLIALLCIAAAIGLIVPEVLHLVFDHVLPAGSMSVWGAAFILLCATGVGGLMIKGVKTVADESVKMQIGACVQAACMARIINLKPGFFKRFSIGDLSTRIRCFNTLISLWYECIPAAGLSFLFSLVFLFQVNKYAPGIFMPSLCIVAASAAFALANAALQMKAKTRAMEAEGKKNGMTHAMLAGIQKIKLSGSEKRALTRWIRVYAEQVRSTYGLPKLLLLSPVVASAIPVAGAILLLALAVQSNISAADLIGFGAAYGLVSSGVFALIKAGTRASAIPAVLAQIRPILEAEPEVEEDKRIVTRLSGGLEVEGVSFRYGDDLPLILDDVTLKIKPGQYVAIVGKTGSGKSTLLRLLLGFETPLKGAIYYDRQDLEKLDLKSLRQRIGVVMQNDRLFMGDILSNITLSAPWLTLKEAWKAAEIAGIAEDIRAMPMGMHTVITEGGGGISGGQRQRLMIARALAADPQILMFDEATSALDNITQKKISLALEEIKCTRIVIAHRLSTIRHCDRIIVLEKGRIIEDGTYEELLARNGQFTELVKRQRLDHQATDTKEAF